MKKTYSTRLLNGWFSYRYEGGDVYGLAEVCPEMVRKSFDVKGCQSLDFVVTNSPPKTKTNWHILHKNANSIWHLSSRPDDNYYGLMASASRLLSNDFPTSNRLYVSAYG